MALHPKGARHWGGSPAGRRLRPAARACAPASERQVPRLGFMGITQSFSASALTPGPTCGGGGSCACVCGGGRGQGEVAVRVLVCSHV